MRSVVSDAIFKLPTTSVIVHSPTSVAIDATFRASEIITQADSGAALAIGASTASAIGNALVLAIGAAAGTSTTSAAGESTAAAVAVSADTATVAGIGAGTVAAVAISAGTSTAAAGAEATAAAQSAGVSTATAVAEATAAAIAAVSGASTAVAHSEFVFRPAKVAGRTKRKRAEREKRIQHYTYEEMMRELY